MSKTKARDSLPTLIQLTTQRKHWKARLITSLAMLMVAFASVLIVKIHHNSYWILTCIMAAVDMILSIGLIWYMRASYQSDYFVTVTKLVLHWLGLLITTYFISIFIKQNALNQNQAGIFNALLLALTLYSAGLYTDFIFILVAIILAVLTLALVVAMQYLWIVILPVVIITVLIIIMMIKKNHNSNSDNVY